VTRKILPERVSGRPGDGFALDLVRRPDDTGFQHQEAERNLPLERIRNADYRAFGNIWMRRPDFLDLPRGEAMSGDIDDVVGSGHHMEPSPSMNPASAV
jgi:hypothetical protein